MTGISEIEQFLDRSMCSFIGRVSVPGTHLDLCVPGYLDHRFDPGAGILKGDIIIEPEYAATKQLAKY